MSDNDYGMASELFRNNSTEYTWEQYYDRLKKDYPIKFFFAYTIPNSINMFWRTRISMPIGDFFYKIKCFVLTKHKYHLIDIRKATKYEESNYTHGWMDSDWRMTYAMFSILVDFVENEISSKYCPSEEEVALDDGTNVSYTGMRAQRSDYLEIISIYNYWTKERLLDINRYDDALNKWSQSHREHKGDPNEETKLLWEQLQKIKEENDNKLEDMLHRLIKVRHSMWT